jgi:hypothetical protein
MDTNSLSSVFIYKREMRDRERKKKRDRINERRKEIE